MLVFTLVWQNVFRSEYFGSMRRWRCRIAWFPAFGRHCADAIYGGVSMVAVHSVPQLEFFLHREYRCPHRTEDLRGSMPFCVELDNLKDTDVPIHQPAAMLVAAD